MGPSSAAYTADQRDSIGFRDGGTKARKGSLRYAVRRIFGRRSKEPDPEPSQVSPPRHGYQQSETIGLTPQEDASPSRTRDDGLVQRTRSTPIAGIPMGDVQRTRSPYAMQFPHSARLKPLDLANPFAAPESQLRRRKTLPSLQIAESDATALAASLESPSKSRGHANTKSRDVSTPDVEAAVSTSKREKRRSRSAGDLRRSQRDVSGSPRKKREEMRQWRESFQGSVLRASGFRTHSPSAVAAEKRDEDRTPIPRTEDPFDIAMAKVTPAFQRDMSERDVGSASAFDTDFSRDLEDRVARLEAGLQSFRGQLAQLSADRNRRTVLIGGVPMRPRASSGGRTASILATDLQQDLEPSNYQYDYTRNVQSPTSPPPPRTPTRTDPSTVTPTFSFDDRTVDDPFVSPSRAPTVSAGSGNNANPTLPPQHTFRSLYEMLADERSARRKLETQMKALRADIANLHYQVSLQSNIQSQRSSYYAPMDPMVGSSRLHALLRDTETSPPSTAHSQQQREFERFSTSQQGLVSRFSGSESETGGAAEAEELQTPYDAYQTPQEEQGRFPLTEQVRTAGGMF